MLRGSGGDHPSSQPSQQFHSESSPRPLSMQMVPGSPSSQITSPDGSGYGSPRYLQNRLDTTYHAPLEPLQEYHSGFADDDAGSPFPPSQHRRQQSFPTLLPLAFRSRTPSPTRNTQRFSLQMPLTGDGRNGKADSPRGGLAGWLSGTSSPSAPGAHDRTPNPDLVSKGSSRDATPDATPTRLRRSTTNSADPAKKTITSTASRFMSAISSRFAPGQMSPALDDELCNLNVEAALMSPTSPSGEAFSPAAFKNLQMNAVGLLTKMQTAYRGKVVAIKEIEAERGAQKDELEEAETRVEHLKMQLEGMAMKAAETEQAMRDLVRELTAERKARAEEQLFIREKGLPIQTEGSMVSEDLGVDDAQLRRKWRKSADTVKSDETTFETDDESNEGESVFSRSRSPTTAPSTFEGSMVDGPVGPTKHNTLSPPKAKTGQQLSALQKIIKNISGEAEAGTDACQNCQGQDASAAWDTVSLLRDENRHLKLRVGQLEDAVEGALDMVRGIGL